MMKSRERKSTDEEDTIKCIFLLQELMNFNCNVEGNIWVAAMFSIIARSMKASDGSYEEFCKVLDDIKKHFKSLWD